MRRDTGPGNDNPGSAAAVGCTLSLLPGFLKPEWLRDVLVEKPRLSVRVTTVDFIPIQTVQFRDMPDGFLPDWFNSLDRVLALDWERMIPGHPYAVGRLGTKDDVRDLKQYMTDLSNAVKQAAEQGKCFDAAMKEIELPKYEK